MTKDQNNYLKNWLFRANEDVLDFPRTHDLEFLLFECQKIDQSDFDFDFGSLTDFGVSVRYPDDFFVPDKEDTILYLKIALEVKNVVEDKIKV
jgi:hypothetical protein